MSSILWYGGHERLIEAVRADGLFVYDENGKAYMDLESGVWCLPLGHGAGAVKSALTDQMNKCFHTGYAYSCSVVEEAADKLLESVSFENGRCVFLSSGSEAVETGAQLMRKVSGRKFMTMADSFLGSHGSVCEMEPDEWYLFDWSKCLDYSEDYENCPEFNKIPFEDIGGFIFEPGSSAGLVRFPPEKLITAISKRLKEHGGLIMVNEVTTGIGRTGKLYGHEHYSIKPDIVAIGKGIGNGYPVSATLMTSDVAKLAKDKSFGISQSHQNDPAGAAVAIAVLEELNRADLVKNSEDVGIYFMERINELKSKHACISEIRGRGLMLSITFEGVEDDYLKGVFNKLVNAGYILVKRPGLKVFRIDPPLIISEEDINGFVKTLDEILSA